MGTAVEWEMKSGQYPRKLLVGTVLGRRKQVSPVSDGRIYVGGEDQSGAPGGALKEQTRPKRHPDENWQPTMK